MGVPCRIGGRLSAGTVLPSGQGRWHGGATAAGFPSRARTAPEHTATQHGGAMRSAARGARQRGAGGRGRHPRRRRRRRGPRARGRRRPRRRARPPPPPRPAGAASAGAGARPSGARRRPRSPRASACHPPRPNRGPPAPAGPRLPRPPRPHLFVHAGVQVPGLCIRSRIPMLRHQACAEPPWCGCHMRAQSNVGSRSHAGALTRLPPCMHIAHSSTGCRNTHSLQSTACRTTARC